MGELEVPDWALYGASTQRAVINFPVSGLRFSRTFVAALGIVKAAAAHANLKLGILARDKGEAIEKAAAEVISGALDQHFVVDIFQSGSGTSTNMNANEVIANRANELLGGARGDRSLVHPNDHVNISQSSNDVMPTALHVAAWQALEYALLPALQRLFDALVEKSREFREVYKAGRTHLQDAAPLTLGQEFGGYAAQIEHGIERARRAQRGLRELALGGTAVGTGVNAPQVFVQLAIERINSLSGGYFVEAQNHFEAQSARDGAVEASGQLRVIACSLIKIADDLRWLASGPRCGLAEISLPALQPGSSIMPGKVNPVVCESTLMVATQVIGNDGAVATAVQRGNFELNTMLPVIAYNLLQSIELLAAAARNFSVNCVEGITAHEKRCRELAEQTLASCVALVPALGYDLTAEIAGVALRERRSLHEVALERGGIDQEQLMKLLSMQQLTGFR